jgi:hypothetical protein
MSGHLPSRKHTRCATQQGSGADRKQEPFPLGLLADEYKHFNVVHERLLPVTAGHKQNIKYFRFCNARIRRKPKPLHVANRRTFLADDLNGCIRHA